MPDIYQSFSELEANEREGESWSREYVDRGSRILVMAPHGGWIEPYTSKLARLVAGNDLSFYTFQGLKPSENETLHLTSHRFDEPLAMEAVSAAHWVLAIHGERSQEEVFVMVGGLWDGFQAKLTAAFREAGIPVQPPREGLEGIHPENICNRGLTGAGGQLEISEGLRRRLRKDEETLFQFVEIVRGGLLELEAEAMKGKSRVP
jgi:phage replication-related protein YjqB (UPF0714/DUF867 family)